MQIKLHERVTVKTTSGASVSYNPGIFYMAEVGLAREWIADGVAEQVYPEPETLDPVEDEPTDSIDNTEL